MRRTGAVYGACMAKSGGAVRSWVLFGLGVVMLAGAFGAFSALGIGYTSSELCIVRALDDMGSSGTTEPLAKATRLWLPVVGASCTWALRRRPSDPVCVRHSGIGIRSRRMDVDRCFLLFSTIRQPCDLTAEKRTAPTV